MASKSRYDQLLADLEKLQREIEAERSVLVRDAVATCRALIDEYGLTAYDLGLIRTQNAKTMAVKPSDKTFAAKLPTQRQIPPKYIDPATGSTWSGRGHTPGWMVGNRDDYLIAEVAEKPARATQNNAARKA